jgi:hypothetical protein
LVHFTFLSNLLLSGRSLFASHSCSGPSRSKCRQPKSSSIVMIEVIYVTSKLQSSAYKLPLASQLGNFRQETSTKQFLEGYISMGSLRQVQSDTSTARRPNKRE